MQPKATSFRVGGPITDPAEFVGRKEILSHISNAMFNLQNISLHGERRTGKTSLLLYLANSSAQIGLPENYVPVYFNFQEFTEASITTMWQALADAIADGTKKIESGLKTEQKKIIKESNKILRDSIGSDFFVTGFGRALSMLREIDLKINLLFDEFDQTIRNSQLGDPFYDALRSLPTRAENISYVIASRTGLAALQPTYSKVSSPFFNIFTSMTLEPFKEDEVLDLIFEYFSRADISLELAEKLAAESEFLYRITGYHPFFLQTYCYHLCAHLDDEEWPGGRTQKAAMEAFERDSEPHFKFYWDVSTDSERGLMSSLASEEPIDWQESENIAVAEQLRDRCLVVPSREKEGEWQLISLKLGEWVEEEIKHPHRHHTRKKPRALPYVFGLFLLLLLVFAFSPALRDSLFNDPGPGALATISILSQPEGATVILAGDSIGVTPIYDYHVKSGLNLLRLEKPDFFALDSSIIIETGQKADLSFSMVAAARVSIQVEPQDALVILDEKRLRPNNLTSFVLPAGEHQVSISAEGFQNLNTSIHLQKGKNPPLNFSLNKIAQPVGVSQETGLRIISIPANADIFLDNRSVGTTPYSNMGLAPGDYLISIRLEGYEDYSTTMTVSDNKVSEKTVRLRELTGMLTIETQPGLAMVYLDGRHMGTTPYKGEGIKIGDHSVLIRKEGYEDFSTLVTIETNEESRVATRLKMLIGKLSVRVSPYGSIVIDGQLHKKDTNIQYTTDLSAGNHELTIEHPVLGGWSKTIDVPADGVEEIFVDFTQEVRLEVTAFDEDNEELNAEIFIDGKAIGDTTPQEKMLRVGLHTIEVRLDGYSLEEGSRKINLEQGRASEVAFRLTKN